MVVCIKGFSGCDYVLDNKTISLRGGCFLNEISKADFNEICQKYQSFQDTIDSGAIVVSEIQGTIKANDEADKVKADIKAKQDKAQKAVETKTNTKIKKG